MLNIFTYLRNSFLFLISMFILVGCAVNSNFEPKKSVKNFDMYEFSGSWYELANLIENNETHKNIKVNFSIDDKGKIKVVKSFKNLDNQNIKDEFSAKIISENNSTILELSKFVLVKEKYSVAKIDGYKYAMLYGQDSLYILSRTKTIPELMKVVYLNHAKKDGYDISKIKWIIQE